MKKSNIIITAAVVAVIAAVVLLCVLLGKGDKTEDGWKPRENDISADTGIETEELTDAVGRR